MYPTHSCPTQNPDMVVPASNLNPTPAAICVISGARSVAIHRPMQSVSTAAIKALKEFLYVQMTTPIIQYGRAVRSVNGRNLFPGRMIASPSTIGTVMIPIVITYLSPRSIQ